MSRRASESRRLFRLKRYPIVNDLQQGILDYVAAFADQHPCVAAIYIFGSVAHGETHQAKDVDLAIYYLPGLHKDNRLTDSYEELQLELKNWEVEGGKRFGKRFKFERRYINDLGNDALRAVLRAASKPVAVKGKAIMVATPLNLNA
jgi:predicted nucleotidyltransferase